MVGEPTRNGRGGLPFRAFRAHIDVVSLLLAVYPSGVGGDDAEDHWRPYWMGAGELSPGQLDRVGGATARALAPGVVWEWLIEGRVARVDEEPVF
ncbi:MAG: hypothetical protein FWD74_05105 [Actinomycetia bacterium]|nr:hypothetical protein [Actinomycetes bacterium]